MKQTVLLSHHRRGTEMDEPISLNADTSVTPLLPPTLGLQVNDMLISLSHLFCFPAKF